MGHGTMATNLQIVVGVDGYAGGQRALHWAMSEAARLGGTVAAVTAWHPDQTDKAPTLASRLEARARAATMLASQIDALPEDERTGIDITTDVVEGPPAEVLATAADHADLLVLGSKGHGRLWNIVFGSISEDCIRSAGCAVVVVPPGRDASGS